MPRRRLAVLLVPFGAVVSQGLACGDDEGSGLSDRTCGDQLCSVEQCESPLRCPTDCGACQGAQCNVSGNRGSCGAACDSSCDCVNGGELCTADYGERPGRCVPVGCLGCDGFERCSFAPDGNGFCASSTCQ